ncbi:hypothetical protein A8139_05445 [Marinomonas primoryensis]|uniref:Uncharacterized protein n=1 Tax=Marinomonas primoryensis TaxID=178399 RepID=A0A2Z4PPP3_9GAMM|nr:hypothetical protein [Marinomonas primoryensis]AWX99495.1 hypothetical protein A8139_05445 [Marinomonas primoryensis]
MEENGIFLALLTIHTTVIGIFITISYAIYSFYENQKSNLKTEIGDHLYDYISESGTIVHSGKNIYEVKNVTYKSFNDLVFHESKRLYYDIIGPELIHKEKKPNNQEIIDSYKDIRRSYYVFLRKNVVFNKNEKDTIHLKIDDETRNRVKKMISITDDVRYHEQSIFSPPTLLTKISRDIKKIYESDKEKHAEFYYSSNIVERFENLFTSCESYLKPAEKNFNKIEAINNLYIPYKKISKVAIFEMIFGILLPLLLINGLPINILKFGIYDLSTWSGYFLALITLLPYAYYISNPEKILQKK